MTDLLCRLFVSGGEDVENPRVRAAYGTFSGIVGIILNILLFGFKMTAGYLTGSLAIMADAWNNLSDAGSSVVSLVGFRLAAKPADREHPFGHARMEYIASIMVSFIILLIGAELFFSSVERIFHPVLPVFHIVAMIVLAVSALCKLWLYFFNRRLSKKIGSGTLRATAADSLNDALSTTAVLISQLIFYFFSWNIDAYMGLIVSGLIVYAGIGILRDTQNHLLGTAPVAETVVGIRRIVDSYPEALGIHDMLVHSYGAGHTFATLHVEVDGSKNFFDMHDAIDEMERRIREELSIECTIHMDPIVTDDERVTALRARISALVSEIEPRLSIHDFRFVEGATHTNLIFDVVVPFELRAESVALIDAIVERIKKEDSRYCPVISRDWA